jgi:acetyltransferase-like isoleucine patch superfamily enzyme
MFQPSPLQRIAPDVRLGRDVKVYDFVNLYSCTIGDETKVGTFVEIQKNAVVGARCKISSHAFVCEGVTIEDDCFIGHHVCFTNDLYPRAVNEQGGLQTEQDWRVVPTRVCRGASIGSGAVILAGVTIGEYALVGAGTSRVTTARHVAAGNPARVLRALETPRRTA